MSPATAPSKVEGPGAAGRPRDAHLDAAIEAATVELISERGYSGLSIKAVAERAGTSTPAIYRRWSSKAELVLATVFRTEGSDVVADSGDLEADVRAMVRWTLVKIGHPVGRAALAGLLGEPAGTAVGLQGQLSRVWQVVGERLQRAVDAGEVRSDLEVGVQISALAGPALMVVILHGQAAVNEDTVHALASLVLKGIQLPSARGAATRKASGR